jgi:hypothetical protein
MGPQIRAAEEIAARESRRVTAAPQLPRGKASGEVDMCCLRVEAEGHSESGAPCVLTIALNHKKPTHAEHRRIGS